MVSASREYLIGKPGTVIHLINLPDKLQQQLRDWSCPEKQDCAAAAAGEEVVSPQLSSGQWAGDAASRMAIRARVEAKLRRRGHGHTAN